MAKAEQASYASGSAKAQQSYAKRMCNHVAYALVVYTLMLIFVTAPAMHGNSIFPYFVLVGLVALAIPFLRNLERKWQSLEKSELSTGGLDTRFAVDRTKLWAAAILAPIALSFAIRAFSGIF